MRFFRALRRRNSPLFWFGWINAVAAIFLVGMSMGLPFEYAGVNAWYKPLKFALSTTAFSWAMGWYTGYLADKRLVSWYNWIIIITLGFEVFYIAFQAGRGMASHYNQSTPFYSALFVLMAFAATLATLATGYLGLVFSRRSFPQLSLPYVWGIRLGIFIFVVFSLEGFAMGQNMAHTVGANDGVEGLPFLGWSYDYGDLRIAHFVGMHALQVLPLLAYVALRQVWQVIVVAIFYAALAVFTLFLALGGHGILG